MILHFYDDPPPAGPSIFLAGPTTVSDGSGYESRDYEGHLISKWRARFLFDLGDLRSPDRPLREGGTADLHVVIPEFSNARAGFAAQAEIHFGRTVVPEGVPCRPRSWGLLRWEKAALAAVDLVVAWMPCGDHQPGAGFNARPEIQGLLDRWILRAPWPRGLVLGIPRDRSTTAVTRFWALAHEAALPVARDMEEMALMTSLILDSRFPPGPDPA